MIEFGNRMLTYVLVAVAVATFVAAWQSGRRDLRRIALIIALGIPAQAVIGGITVLTDLNPWIVSFHLLCSLAIIGLVGALPAPDRPTRRPPYALGVAVVVLAWATFASAWAVLYVGTVVTGSGPHAGDAESPRNGLSPLQLSQLHADLVFLFVGLTIGLLFCATSPMRRRPRSGPCWCCWSSRWPRAPSASCSTSPTSRSCWSASTCSAPP